jgi:branched-chain amino acid transport system ATP-binding protein
MLSISALEVAFQETTVLKGLSLSAAAGETVGIIGPNGSGKTTLFNCISGFAAQRSGTISLKDQEIQSLPPHERARKGLGRVFQNFGIFRQMTLLENMLLALESRPGEELSVSPWSSAARRRKEEAMERLREIHLEAKALNKASSLSGGQMRLLEIMRTVAAGAEVFLLDEPTAGVSPRMKDDVTEIIRRLQALKKTVLIIEHDITFIERFCGRIVVLNEGHVVLDDIPERVRADERLKEIYFGQGA